MCNINFYVIPKFQPQNGRQIFSNASHFMAIDEGQGGGYREVHHRRGGDHLGVPVGLEEVAAGHEEPRPHRLGAGGMGWEDGMTNQMDLLREFPGKMDHGFLPSES